MAIQNGCQFFEVSVAENSSDLYQAFESLLNESRCQQSANKTRKFSVTKMIGTLIGSGNSKEQQKQSQSGTVVVCHKSDLHKTRVLKRRQNFTATASLWLPGSLGGDTGATPWAVSGDVWRCLPTEPTTGSGASWSDCDLCSEQEG